MRYKVVVSYDGTNFHGWQRQRNDRTVQEEIEKCISKINKETTTIYGSGRTDASVHAVGQVFHFDSRQKMNQENWYRAINSLLPKDIIVLNVEKVESDFHARYDAKSKEYRYFINIGKYDIFKRNYYFQTEKSLDVDKMIKAANVFVGTHDFSSFNATSYEEVKNQIRTLESLNFLLEDDILEITLRGTGFLRYMVRMIVGVLYEIGKGNLEIEDVQELLDKKQKGIVTYRMPGHGLYLYSVDYNKS